MSGDAGQSTSCGSPCLSSVYSENVLPLAREALLAPLALVNNQHSSDDSQNVQSPARVALSWRPTLRHQSSQTQHGCLSRPRRCRVNGRAVQTCDVLNNSDYSENVQLPACQAPLALVASLTIGLHSVYSENVQVPACPALMAPVACVNKEPSSDYSENLQ